MYKLQSVKQQEYLYDVHPQMVIKYWCKHWIKSPKLGQFSFLVVLSTLCHQSKIEGAHIVTIVQWVINWFLKLLKVNGWHFLVRASNVCFLTSAWKVSKCADNGMTVSLCCEALNSVFHCLLLKPLWDQDRIFEHPSVLQFCLVSAKISATKISNSQLFSSAYIFNSQNWISTRILRVCKCEFRALNKHSFNLLICSMK